MNHANNTLLWIILAVLIIVSGCASTGGTTSKWLGRPESELVATLGKPDNVATLPDGRKVLSWDSYTSPMQAVPCRDSYTIGRDGNVEEFIASTCGPRPLSPAYPRSRRGF